MNYQYWLLDYNPTMEDNYINREYYKTLLDRNGERQIAEQFFDVGDQVYSVQIYSDNSQMFLRDHSVVEITADDYYLIRPTPL